MPMSKVKPTIVRCLWCGEEFETGGRGRPKRGQVFCSKQCTAFARVHQPTVNRLSIADAAYLAGLIDGEGSIVAAMKREHNGRITWRLAVSNTDFDLLNWCKDVTGVGSVIRHMRDNPKHADSGYWQSYSWNARDILVQTLPYMKIAEKRRRAEQMIAELGRIRQLSGG